MHAHFERLVEELATVQDDAERYRQLGGLVGYLQLMTSPARVVPVYTGRFWRWSLTDRFDTYRIDDEALEARLQNDCADLLPAPASFQTLLVETADETLEAVRAPIAGLPATWEAFWKISDDPGGFGEYGPAGNSFGRKTTFPCVEADDAPPRRCVLLDRDPIYAAFALERHAAAVRSTARAMVLVQQQWGDREGVQGGAPAPDDDPRTEPEAAAGPASERDVRQE
jgi:hypothetical protein